MLVCVIPLAPGPSIAKQTKVLEENVIGKYTNLFGASNPHCRLIYRQWGYCTTETTPYMTQKLNINYTKENYFVIGCDGGGSRNLYSFPNRTLSKFNIANTATGQMVLWFSIGA